MTEDEAKRTFRDLFTIFPSVYSWLNATDDPQNTYDRWVGILSQIESEDAQRVLRGVVKAEYPDLPSPREPDRWPIWLVMKAREFSGGRYERRESFRRREEARGGRPQDGLADVLNQAIRDRDPLAALEAAAGLDFQEPRYRCDTCRDTGAVEVWSAEVIHQLVTAKPIVRLKTETCACECDFGEGLRTPNAHWAGAPVYDPEKYLRVIGPSWEDLAGLSEWLEARGVMVPDPVPGGRFAHATR